MFYITKHLLILRYLVYVTVYSLSLKMCVQKLWWNNYVERLKWVMIRITNSVSRLASLDRRYLATAFLIKVAQMLSDLLGSFKKDPF